MLLSDYITESPFRRGSCLSTCTVRELKTASVCAAKITIFTRDLSFLLLSSRWCRSCRGFVKTSVRCRTVQDMTREIRSGFLISFLCWRNSNTSRSSKPFHFASVAFNAVSLVRIYLNRASFLFTVRYVRCDHFSSTGSRWGFKI